MSPATSALQSRAAQALRQSPIPALRKLSISESESEIVISGEVTTYYLKQMAQETIMAYRDQRDLSNQVEVVAV